MTFYQSIVPRDAQPYSIGTDPVGRALLGFNVDTVKNKSVTFLEELGRVLIDAGLGVLNTTLFLGSEARLPVEADVAFLHIQETGGPTGLRTHNDSSNITYPRPTALVVAHGPDYAATRALAHAAWEALSRVRNTNVVP